MPNTLTMTANYEHAIDGVFICDADFVLEVGYTADRNGEVYDFWIDNIGTEYRIGSSRDKVRKWIPERSWKEPLISAALEHFKSSKSFARDVQEKADAERAWEAA